MWRKPRMLRMAEFFWESGIAKSEKKFKIVTSQCQIELNFDSRDVSVLALQKEWRRKYQYRNKSYAGLVVGECNLKELANIDRSVIPNAPRSIYQHSNIDPRLGNKGNTIKYRSWSWKLRTKMSEYWYIERGLIARAFMRWLDTAWRMTLRTCRYFCNVVQINNKR